MLRALLLGLGLLLPAPMAAQFVGHPVGPGLRPLHERLDGVEVVALVRVEQVDEGRVRVHSESVLAGAPPEVFEVKRSPLTPPPLATGDRALLLLRGARPPYVLADLPAEVIRIADDAMAARWQQALREVIERRAEPASLVNAYLGWLDGEPETLSELGRSGLLDLGRKHPELRERIGRELASRP